MPAQSTPPASPPVTPTTKGKKIPATPKSGGQKRKANVKHEDDDGDEGFEASPSGKKKKMGWDNETRQYLGTFVVQKGVDSLTTADNQILSQKASVIPSPHHRLDSDTDTDMSTPHRFSSQLGKDVSQIRDQFKKNRSNVLSALLDKAGSL